MTRLLAGVSAVLLACVLGAVVCLSLALGSARSPSKAEEANKEAALGAVGEMLADVQVPAGATEFPSAPPGTNVVLAEPAASRRPRTVVTRHRWWVSSLDTEETLKWLGDHPPLGSKPRWVGEIGTSAPGAVVAHTLEVQWPAVPGVLEKRTLEFASVDRRAGGSVLKATAEVEWTVPHPASARIPDAARFLEMETTGTSQTSRKEYTISAPKSVDKVAAVIDALPARQPGRFACPQNKVPPPTVYLRFRRARGAPVLAEAEQRWPPGFCRFFDLTIHGRRQSPLSEGNQVVNAVRALVKR